ncbi:lytic transglycosylase domain-containing protein [Leptospira interrogans]|uniref:Lytic transglycosylase domain-containing protein n=6 Tax=Leptospira interrogans TaxID=173 RepID=A0AAV9FPI0_LEPIR|nr:MULTISPECIES: lytic transglycosylase domain-containing protein [Leptospira]KAA1264087.1 lytic transglycosylase domain-containing protein [Leptospira interrogans serovar Weerasinghe]KAA1293638.1 lytic transglycosylase domain-containing protein [Leptospira interrogans serovar Geyaweera]ASV10397.1 lytic transglycosylase [Leptospira interrogans serovar Canicola]EKR29219.1 transglycosylase SLT domain protein [Leptospira interrogans serovar Bataviae str. L1111]KAK2617245.1 lytic transglycosylase 
MILREYSERHNMRIEEIPNVQLVLSRIQEIENRFVKEAPTQSKEQTKNSFDSILKSEQGKSISSLEKEKNFGKDLKNIEPSLAKIIHQESEKNNLDPRLVQSVIKAESDFKTDAVSPKGAIGLMQLMPSTANLLGVEDPFDPAENVAGGTKFLSNLLNKYKNLDHALAAYNAGPSAVDRYAGIPPYKETRNYVEKVKKFYSSNTE